MSRVIGWGCRLLLVATVAIAAGGCLLIGMRLPVIGVGVLALLAWERFRGGFGEGWAYGTARLASVAELFRAGLINGRSGLIIGTTGYLDKPTKAQAFRWLLSPLTSSLAACRLFFAGCCLGWRWNDANLIRVRD